MVVFTDFETKNIINELNLPLIPDICVDLNGQKFQSDKRHFDRYIKIAAAESIALDRSDSPFFTDYDSLLNFYKKLEILPSYE